MVMISFVTLSRPPFIFYYFSDGLSVYQISHQMVDSRYFQQNYYGINH